jgi:hypothetical protein
MYSVQTPEHQRDSLKQKTAYFRDAFPASNIRGRSAALHESSPAVEQADEPWMKHMTQNVSDLMNDKIDPKEEFHMRIPSGRTTNRASQSLSLSPINRRSTLMSTLDDSPTIGPPQMTQLSDTSSSNGSPFPQYYRLDRVVDSEDDIDREVEILLTALDRQKLEGCPQPRTCEELKLEFSESFVTEQQNILSRIQQQPQSPAVGKNSTIATDDRQSTVREEKVDAKGSKIRIHDQSRVYAAIKEGTAKVLKCIGCSRHMLATSDIKLVFCPGCGTLTPVEMGEVPPSQSNLVIPIV